jgi:enamine deaminase RidA (YjgF/YER057c/UK114 family)
MFDGGKSTSSAKETLLQRYGALQTSSTESESTEPVFQPVPLPAHCHCDRKECNGEVVEIVTSCAREIFLRCDPASFSENHLTASEQAQAFYGCLPRILENAGSCMANVVLERVFVRNMDIDLDCFLQARAQAYRKVGLTGDQLPVTSYVEQPPCTPGQAFELQVYAVVPQTKHSARVTAVAATDNLPPGKLVQIGPCRHLYVRGVVGQGRDGQPLEDFRAQSDAMFAAIREILQRQGAKFHDVLRTWCYLDQIDRDYDQFNASRNAFFECEKVSRLPASTGIRAGLTPRGTLCATDFYALLNSEDAQIEIMHTPTLNEAPAYGSAFSRGMKISLPEKTVLFISGTASVDEGGATIHVGDSGKQIERMLLNVQQLLKPHGASFADLVQVISYLKSADDLEIFRKIASEWGLVSMPNSIVKAGVCRPNLLCEMEAIAILPKSDHCGSQPSNVDNS